MTPGSSDDLRPGLLESPAPLGLKESSLFWERGVQRSTIDAADLLLCFRFKAGQNR